MPQCFTGFKEMIFHFLQSRQRPSFSAHCPAQNIPIRSRKPSEMKCNFNHVFLINHDSIGFPELFFKNFVEIFKLIRIIMPEDVFFHHPALGNTRSDNGRSCHQYFVIITLHSPEQSSHGRTFNIETTDCFSFA